MTEYKRRWEAREVALTFNQNGTVTYFTQVRARGLSIWGLVDPDLDPERHSLLLHTGKERGGAGRIHLGSVWYIWI